MPCATGQIQIGIDPNIQKPICMEDANSTSNNIGNPQTGASGAWWGQVINILPGVLGGVADIVGASNGNPQPDSTVVIQPPPNPNQQKKSTPWGWIIGLIVIVFAIITFLIWKRKTQ
ncbi:MAG: hypothetical protein NXI23_14555 [Bacteroidetes bacterium]|jgi:hypothetical protein|nr:hypothetical protein [Bacteroidota bacterium]MDF1863619.1 hypothetical protein [Saprospiraceae bacterium]